MSQNFDFLVARLLLEFQKSPPLFLIFYNKDHNNELNPENPELYNILDFGHKKTLIWTNMADN